MAGQNAARADATGKLSATPLSDMLITLLERAMTGSLIVQDPEGNKSAFAVEGGAIVKARTADPVVRLGDLLVELHAVDPPTVDRGLRLGKQGGIPLGQALLRLEAIAEPMLDAALGEQLARRMVWACGLPQDTRYGFYSGVDYLSGWGFGPVVLDPLALIWKCSKDHAPADRVEGVVSRLASRPLVLHPAARVDRFHFGWDEAATFERVAARRPQIGELLVLPGIDRDTMARMLYVLALTRHLDLGDGRPPSGVGPNFSVPPPAARVRSSISRTTTQPSAGVSSMPNSSPPSSVARMLSMPPGDRVSSPSITPRPLTPSVQPNAPSAPPAPTARVTTVPRAALDAPASTRLSAPPTTTRPDPLEWRLNAKLLQCNRGDLFGLLELGRDAAPGTVQAAFVKLAKVWHPDRLPPAMAHRREEATRLFARLSEARRILTDPVERARYEHELDTGEKEEETVTRVVEASNEFRKAEQLAKRNDYIGAVKHAEAAYRADEEQAEYAAFYAFVVVQSAPDLDTRRIEELVKLVEGAAEKEPENIRIRLYRGYLYKRAGRIEEAIRDFKFVARNDRHNVDAMREIRLYNLRKEKEKATSGGLFGGLFGGGGTSPGSKTNPTGKTRR